MSQKKNLVGVRCDDVELALIDALAKQRNCSRNEAVRIAIRAGAKGALTGYSIDPQRLTLLLEYTQAAIDIIVHREHADVAGELKTIAEERMEAFHAPQ
ncbi:MAG: ribbon-helix-helix protein, CopG family [Erythrobacter sp.]